MNAKQRRFAQEYAVDHNATVAAIRAGYAEKAAKQTGHKLLQKPEVAQLVGKLDAEKAGWLDRATYFRCAAVPSGRSRPYHEATALVFGERR